MKRILSVLQGKVTDYSPIWLMRQAGRYLPEYREMRAKAGSFMKLCFTPDYAAEVTLQPVRRFNMDGAILFSDILVVPHALGLSLEFVEGEGPKLQRVENTVPVFDAEKFFKISAPIFETVRLTKAALPAHTTMLGFAGSPYTVACYMLGGKGADEFIIARQRIYKEPELFQKILDVLVEATVFYLSEQIKAGAEALQLFDSWAGLVPAQHFDAYIIQPTAKIVAGVKKLHPTIPIIGFPRMAGANIERYVQQTGVDAVSLDQTMDLKWAQENISVTLQGNLDPLLMSGDKNIMLAEANIILTTMKKPFIFNLGHGLTPNVPPENVEALVKRVQSTTKI